MATFTTTQETVRFTDTSDEVSFTATPGRVSFTAAYQSVTGGGGGGGASDLDDLTDVTITAAANGDILRYNGTAWVDTPGTTHFDAAGTAATAVANARLDFVYDPAGTQTGNVYTSWSDLMTAVNAARARGVPKVLLKSTTPDGSLTDRVKLTVPAGSWNLSNMIFESWQPTKTVTLVCGTGVFFSAMDGLRLDRAVVIRSESDAALYVPGASERVIIVVDNASGLCASGTAEMIELSNSGVQLIFVADNEGGLWNGENIALEAEGSIEVATSSGTGNLFLVTLGQKAVVSNDVFSGTVALYGYRLGCTSARYASITNTNLTVGTDISLILNQATHIRTGTFNGNLTSVSGGTVEQALQAIDNLSLGGGSGDVVGPASSVDGRVALFDGTTGKLLKQGSAAPVLEGDSRLTDARTPTSHTHAASDVTSGTFDTARIPDLAASKVTSGVFAVARLGTGTPDGTKFLRDDGTFVTPASGPFGGASSFGGNRSYMLPGVIWDQLSNAVAVGANTIRYVPFIIRSGTLTVDRIHFEVTTLQASSNGRVGVYAADSSWQPTGAALIDATATTATTGSKNITVSATLTAGRYLACIVSDANISVRAGVARPTWGSDHSATAVTSPAAAQMIHARRVSLTYPASLPNSGPAWTTVDSAATNQASDPLILLRGTFA